MAEWWNQVKKMKWIIFIFLFFIILSVIFYVLMRVGIIHQLTMGFENVLMAGFFIAAFIVFGVFWVVSAPHTPRVLLLLGLAVTTLGIFSLFYSTFRVYNVIAILLIVCSGIPEPRINKKFFLIGYPVYYLIGCIFFDFFALNVFLVHSFAFVLMALGLFFPNKKINYAIASGGLIIPSLVLAFVFLLVRSESSLVEPTFRGELSSPFEEHLLYEQKEHDNFLDTNYELRIYLPMKLGFYRQIGFYYTTTYFPELTPDDFEWETVDEDTYRLHFYEEAGEMKYVFTINL